MKTSIFFTLGAVLFILCARQIAVADLVDPDIAPPVNGLKKSELSDTFSDQRGNHQHGAIDIMRAADTPVHAVSDGFIRKLFLSRAGGITIYEVDHSRRYSYYYAHLQRYAPGLREGAYVARNDVIGYVGTSGDASPFDPQLHFEIHLLDPKRWWQGVAIDPYPVLLDAIDCTMPLYPVEPRITDGVIGSFATGSLRRSCADAEYHFHP